MNIELLAFDGCPNVDETEQRILRALRDERCTATIVRTAIVDSDEAVAQRFLGSPTVRVDGVDVEPLANERTEFGFMCRMYGHGANATGTPPVAMIRAAIRRRLEAGT